MAPRGALVVVGALAVGLRLLYLFAVPQPPITGDASGYEAVARSLAAGDGVSASGWALLGLKGPIYPLFLAGVFSLFSADAQPVRYIQAGLSALTCVVVCSIGWRLVGRCAGVSAGLLAAVYPPLVLLTGRLLTETLSIYLFWLGVLLMLRGLDGRVLAWLTVAGGVVGVACLTRPTLLPAIPVVLLTVFLAAKPQGTRWRIAATAVFGGIVLAVVLSWSLVYHAVSGGSPLAGPAGVNFVRYGGLVASNPQILGWAPDDRSGISVGSWKERFREDPLYVPAALANLVFYHAGFADNPWRESFVLSPFGLQVFHRALLLLGLWGVGAALVCWRAFSPLLCLLLAFAIMALKWIEPRHTLPFLPALFVFAGLFLDRVRGWLGHASRASRTLLLLIAGGLTAAVVGDLGAWNPAFVLPLAAPLVAGRLSDAAVVLLGLAAGGVIYKLARPSLGCRQALVVGFIPAVAFGVLFASYSYVGGEPRWRAWTVDLERLGRPVVQEVFLPAPISTETIAAAAWLVDLQGATYPPPLKIGVNGKWFEPGRYRWQQLFCAPGGGDDTGSCEGYGAFADFAGRSLATWPQWWGISVPATEVGGRIRVSLSLAPADPAPGVGAAARIKLGGAFSAEVPNYFYGPSADALIPGGRTSIYRWIVAEDWRLWETRKVASDRTISSLAPADSHRPQPSAPGGDARALAAIVDRGYGHFNIRLVVRYKDGRRVIY